MRSRPVLAVLAALALLLAACGGDGGDADDGGSPSPTAASADGDATPVELEEGVAAVVNGDEIPTEILESRVETAASAPQVAAVLEGEEGEAARAQLQASILSQLIVNEIVLDGAEERDLEIDDEAISATREELTTQAGGEEAFETQVSDAGLDEEQLAAELEAITALRLVREDLSASESGATPPAPATAPDGSTVDPDDVLLQQWLLEQLQSADVAVAPEIGSWDSNQGAVVPPVVTPPSPADAPASGATPSPTSSPTATATEG